MELKWLLCVTLLALGMLAVQAHDMEDDNDIDDVVDIEDDLDDAIEEIEESKSESSAPPPPPKVTYKVPVPTGEVYFAETFDKGTLDGWILSKAKKDDTDDEIAKYDGKWEVQDMKDTRLPGDKGLVLVTRAKHHAISSKLSKPFVFDTKPLIIQYEVNFQNGIECGGAYVKLLSKTPELNLDQFHDKTPYTIMFGPDKCGEDYKLHFIFRHKNPKTGKYEEKHAKRPDADLKNYFTDKKTHLYTLVLNPDNSFEILVDQAVVNSGNLLNDMTPPVNPPREIEDPNDQKPEDWDERPKIPDPDAVKPDDWDEDMDGEWEAPQIANPKCESAPGCGTWQRPMMDNPNYKGKWKPPMIDNVNYQGIWKPRKIPNPDFFEDLEPFKMTPFSAVGLELWSMTSDIFFDNFIICTERAVADEWANDGWGLKKAADGAAEPGVVGQMMAAAEERPWLWVVYILTVALPVFLVVLFCCSGKKQTSAAEYKKTDAPQPDVMNEEKEEEKDKGDKEEEEEEETNDEKLEEKQKSDADIGSASQEEEEEEEEEEEDRKHASEEEETVNRSPRNRKPRRD
ncbi:PREDICTED: calnexin isoform X2 [Tinamus guttatus]|uniref:calnexin isoform X2 n=1 Tax=Tinamus guttatus TaxID=94827 RepID=UPI00052EEB51|nr:PREDICTED: calnexin isoform X2 [Tinamus guttatus]